MKLFLKLIICPSPAACRAGPSDLNMFAGFFNNDRSSFIIHFFEGFCIKCQVVTVDLVKRTIIQDFFKAYLFIRLLARNIANSYL